MKSTVPPARKYPDYHNSEGYDLCEGMVRSSPRPVRMIDSDQTALRAQKL
jgi:hypothetical protein